MRFKKYTTQAELAAFLKELAEAVENGGTGDFECVDAFSKMKIGVRNEYGRLRLKVRIETPATCTPGYEGTEARPDYETLKKRMKSSFRMLVSMIHDGQTPPAEAVESFLADSDLMVTYPGYGDEFYESYSRCCAAFKEAFESGDVARMHEAVDNLVHEKGRCHAKYA
jgi:XXXCH domain-containing protein